MQPARVVGKMFSCMVRMHFCEVWGCSGVALDRSVLYIWACSATGNLYLESPGTHVGFSTRYRFRGAMSGPCTTVVLDFGCVAQPFGINPSL